MYREQWVADILGDRSILTCALEVRMTASGSYMRSPDDQDADIRALFHILRTWRETTIPKYRRFDEACREVVRAALVEATGIGLASTRD
jgi:hypothetical protein